MQPEAKDAAYLWDMLDAARAIQKYGECYFSASLISMSRLSTSVNSSDKSTPFCWALAEKYCHTLCSMEAGRKTFASGGMWCRSPDSLAEVDFLGHLIVVEGGLTHRFSS